VCEGRHRRNDSAERLYLDAALQQQKKDDMRRSTDAALSFKPEITEKAQNVPVQGVRTQFIARFEACIP
jgi:hypothetical protein